MIQAQLLAPAGSDLGGGQWAENPPSAAPLSISISINEGSGVVTVRWVNGDASAWTQIGFNASGEPTVNEFLAQPGQTSWEAGVVATDGWWVRHTRGGTPSAWTGPSVL